MESDAIENCIEKAYEEDRLTFFSSLAPYLTDNQKQTWIVRASKDNKNTLAWVLINYQKSNKNYVANILNKFKRWEWLDL